MDDDETPDIPVVMTHFLRPVEGGSQLQSMFWFGYQIIDGKAVKCIPDGVTIPKEGPMCLLNHNVKEFSNLAKNSAGIIRTGERSIGRNKFLK